MSMMQISHLFSAQNVNQNFCYLTFKKLPIFEMKSFISSLLNVFDKESIGFKCFIFLNLLEGGKPTEFLFKLNFLKIYFFFLN